MSIFKAKCFVIFGVSINSKVTWSFISTWSWVLVMFPIFICEFSFSIKRTSSKTSPVWKQIFWCTIQLINWVVVIWTRSQRFFLLKSFVSLDDWKSAIGIFAYSEFSIRGSHLDRFVLTWPWSLPVRHIFLIYINSFRSMSKADVGERRPLIFVLIKRWFTWPGPGTFSFNLW